MTTRVATDFIYMYGIILAEELQHFEVPSIMGIDQKTLNVRRYKELAAIVTAVNGQQFCQQQIDIQLKDANWLQEKAFHHHEVISAIHEYFTILPMSFCTIFQSDGNLESLLINQYDEIFQKLCCLKKKQEWNVKLFCHLDRTKTYVSQHHTAVVELREKLLAMPKGKQFLMKKKLDHLIASEVELEQAKWWEDILGKLSGMVTDSNLRQNWSKQVTERNEEMIVNCDFLIERTEVESFLAKIQQLEQTYERLGCSFQVTGPWPPYHFSKMEKENY